MDRVPAAVRSRMMSRIRSRNTKPEMLVRSYLHREGFRFRLHSSTLPGQPDIVFPGRRICLFVHGCFWHGCPKCRDGQRQPKTNRNYWIPKIERNKIRDGINRESLETAGWKVLSIWECEIADQKALKRLALAVLSTPQNGGKPAQLQRGRMVAGCLTRQRQP